MLASTVHDGRLEIIDGGSHMCPIQEPGRTAQLIRDFVHEV
jgi:pimeloyl-ACP methyl ester carboxylesterase